MIRIGLIQLIVIKHHVFHELLHVLIHHCWVDLWNILIGPCDSSQCTLVLKLAIKLLHWVHKVLLGIASKLCLKIAEKLTLCILIVVSNLAEDILVACGLGRLCSIKRLN